MGRLHGNPAKYWEYQQRVTREKLLPLLKEWGFDPAGKRVLEIGCGDGGIIHTFAEAGAACMGVEINAKRVENGKAFATLDIPIIIGDFCRTDILSQIQGEWDLILLRDVLEHLLDKETAMRNLREILADDGRIFFDFCPWFMPFGGHQQALDSFLKFIPFLHWLPRSVYERLIYRSEKHRLHVFRDIMDTYDARITLAGFYKLLKRHNFKMEHSQLYLLNPSYEIKFGLPEVKLGALAKVPLLPEIAATNIYAWVQRA